MIIWHLQVSGTIAFLVTFSMCLVKKCASNFFPIKVGYNQKAVMLKTDLDMQLPYSKTEMCFTIGFVN